MGIVLSDFRNNLEGNMIYPCISMADLIACSTVIHNKTISDQMNEITALKQKLKVYEPSKVEYTNRLEYETLKTSEYKKIKERTVSWARCIIHRYSPQGLGSTDYLLCSIARAIEDAMNVLTKQTNKEWVKYISWEYMYGHLLGFLSALESTRNLYTILDLGEEVLSNLIYKYIFDRLEYTQEYHLFGLFTCTRCNKKVDYVNDGDICHECEYPSSSDEYEETDDSMMALIKEFMKERVEVIEGGVLKKNECISEFNDWYRIRKGKLHCVIKPKHILINYIIEKYGKYPNGGWKGIAIMYEEDY